MSITSLRINRFKKLIFVYPGKDYKYFITNKDPKLFNSKHPDDICQWYIIYTIYEF